MEESAVWYKYSIHKVISQQRLLPSTVSRVCVPLDITWKLPYGDYLMNVCKVTPVYCVQRHANYKRPQARKCTWLAAPAPPSAISVLCICSILPFLTYLRLLLHYYYLPNTSKPPPAIIAHPLACLQRTSGAGRRSLSSFQTNQPAAATKRSHHNYSILTWKPLHPTLNPVQNFNPNLALPQLLTLILKRSVLGALVRVRA